MIVRHLASFLILFAFLALGGAVTMLLRLPVPGSVVGMILLSAALHFRLVSPAAVRPGAELLIRHMALLFVPPGVGLMVYFDLLRGEWLPITLASVASTTAVLLTVGLLQGRLERHG